MLKEDCLYNSKYIMHCETWSAQDSENVDYGLLGCDTVHEDR